MKVRTLPIDRLIPYARNPRKSEAAVAKVAASLREFGWRQPIVVAPDMVVVVGHVRLAAARLLGMTEVPVHIADGLSPAQLQAYRLADNRTNEEAEWDNELLALELGDLADAGIDLLLTGFDTDELARIRIAGSEGLTDPDAAPALPAVPVTRPGDLWTFGRHRLLCGDSSNIETVRRALGSARPTLMVTDPPYGVNYDASWRQRAGISSPGAAIGVVTNDDRADWRTAWALFPGNVAYVWHGGLHCAVVEESLAACRLAVRAQIVWVKTRPALSRGHYHWQHEPCFYAVREGQPDEFRFAEEHELAVYAVRDGATGAWQGDRKQSTVWFIEHLKSDTGHSTQKPVECMRRPMENNSLPGQLVYDPFSGSGTSFIAAEMLGRGCIGLEIEPGYCDVVVQRWQEFVGGTAVLDGGGGTFAEVAAARAEAPAAAWAVATLRRRKLADVQTLQVTT